MYAENSHIRKRKKGALNFYAPISPPKLIKSSYGGIMAYTIQDSAERAAFERWGDLTAQLIRKYGPALLEKLDAEEKCSEYDAEQTGQAA